MYEKNVGGSQPRKHFRALFGLDSRITAIQRFCLFCPTYFILTVNEPLLFRGKYLKILDIGYGLCFRTNPNMIG